MKYILIIGDGMADDPLEELGGKTPLEVCQKPYFDSLCERGVLGLVQTIPEGFPPGSDTAIMSIFGCDPARYFSGRAPLELAASGGTMPEGGACYRCNMVTLGGDESLPFGEKTMVSHSAGSIEGEESDELIEWLFSHEEFRSMAGAAGMSVRPGSSFRHLAVQRIGALIEQIPQRTAGAACGIRHPGGVACPQGGRFVTQDIQAVLHRIKGNLCMQAVRHRDENRITGVRVDQAAPVCIAGQAGCAVWRKGCFIAGADRRQPAERRPRQGGVPLYRRALQQRSIQRPLHPKADDTKTGLHGLFPFL